MATRRRGFGKERHTALKAGVTLLSLAGMGAGWLVFDASHKTVSEPVATPLPLTATPALPPPPGGTPTATAHAATTTAAAGEPTPRPTRARVSRGS